MPIATPQRMRARVPPRSAASGTFAVFANTSQIAISSVAFAMRLSLIQPRTRDVSSGPLRSAARIRGIAIASSCRQTVSGVSPEYHGGSGATLSPQPTTPPDSTRAMTRVWCVSREPLVSYGDLSGSRMRNVSIRSIFMRRQYRRASRAAAAARAGTHRDRPRHEGTRQRRIPSRKQPRTPRVRAELREVERRVARLERIHRPADDLDALIEAVIALRLLQLDRERRSAIGLTHREHVRVMTEVVVVDAHEAEHESGRDRVVVGVAERDEAAVVHRSEHELRWHDDVTAPHLFL